MLEDAGRELIAEGGQPEAVAVATPCPLEEVATSVDHSDVFMCSPFPVRRVNGLGMNVAAIPASWASVWTM